MLSLDEFLNRLSELSKEADDLDTQNKRNLARMMDIQVEIAHLKMERFISEEK